MCNSKHHSSEKHIFKSTIYCTMLYYFKTKYLKKNHGIRIKSVVYLDFEMQQKISSHSSSEKEIVVTGISKHF